MGDGVPCYGALEIVGLLLLLLLLLETTYNKPHVFAQFRIENVVRRRLKDAFYFFLEIYYVDRAISEKKSFFNQKLIVVYFSFHIFTMCRNYSYNVKQFASN